MNEPTNIDTALLVRYLANETSVDEQQQVDNWLAEKDANRKYMEELRFTWNNSKNTTEVYPYSENEAWERFKNYRQARKQEELKVVSIKPKRFWMAIAASFLVLLSAASLYWVFMRSPSDNLVFAQASSQPVNYTLPDGSTIVLNKGSQLSYPETFAGNTRKVSLKGEAFFTITPNKNKPFIIDVNGAQVTVVGTSFNIKNTGDKTEVIVETGIVQVENNRQIVELRPKQMAVMYKTEAPVKQNNTEELYKYYRTAEFVCNNTPLQDLVATLQEAYAVKIIIDNNAIKSLPLTTTLRNGNLKENLQILSNTFNVNVEEKGGEYHIR